jgi:hypothetical protein
VANVEAAAAAVEIEDVDGARHALAELWAQGPAVLVFLRHFG